MRLRLSITGSALGILALLAACSTSGTLTASINGQGNGSTDAGTGDASTSDSSVTPTAPGPVARFKLSGDTPPNFLDVPFPTDAYLANGKVMEPIPGFDQAIPDNSQFITHGLGQLNGWSRIALSIFAVDDTSQPATNGPVPALIDRTTLPVAETDCTKDTSAIYLLDLAQGATTVRLPCRADYHNDQPKAQTTPTISAGPPRGFILQEGHPYAVVLTSRIKDTQGRALAPSADMLAIANGTATGAVASLYAPVYTAANAALQSALATDGAKIVAIAPYTTMKKTGEIFQAREALESAPVPTLAWDATSMAPMGAVKFATPVGTPAALPAGFTASLDDLFGVVAAADKLSDGTDDPDIDKPVRAHNQLSAMGTAVFKAISYLQVKPSGYTDIDGNTFAFDASGKLVAQTPVNIWATFFIPSAPMPAGGYPAIVVQHGLSGSRLFAPSIANLLASKGWLVVAIDSVTFGARAAEPQNTTDTANAWAGSPGQKYTGPDGFADMENGSNDF
ncbi:MAG TPA: hypothetical protein VGI39_38100, partial [Polyangiaceae bacterium]